MLPSIYDKLEGDIMNASRRDDELAELIDMQPSRFAVSQLRSFKEMALKGKACSHIAHMVYSSHIDT